MEMSDPHHLSRFLAERGLSARKSLSQNFLVDRTALRRIVEATGLVAEQRVLEIGPGPGALTEAFLAQGIAVTAIELDRGFCQALRERQRPDLEVVEGDALTTPLAPLLHVGGIRVAAGNLPYSITTPLLGRLLPLHPLLDRVVVMVQKEVAERMCASAGGKTYGLLSVFVQLHGTPSLVTVVPAKAFRPVPQVDSAVVTIDLHPTPAMGARALELARCAFQQRRKMVRGTLAHYAPPQQFRAALEAARINPEDRPERISVAQWCDLARVLFDSDCKSPDPDQ